MLSIHGNTFAQFGRWFFNNGWKLLHSFKIGHLWEAPNKHVVFQTTDSVAFLIVVRGAFGEPSQVVLVRQYRPATTDPEDNPQGLITEVTAGRFDAALTIIELIAQEAGQEVGAKIRPDQVILINDGEPLYLSPGIITEKQILAVVVIDRDQIEDEERVFGNAAEGERINRVHRTVHEFIQGVHQDMKTFALATWLGANMQELGL